MIELNNNNCKFLCEKNKWTSMAPMTPLPRSSAVTASLMPLAKRYKKAHYFKAQVIKHYFYLLLLLLF